MAENGTDGITIHEGSNTPPSKEQLIADLDHTHDRDQIQGILNQLFTEKHREALVSQAPVDSQGRKVRYYREMWLQDLQVILHKGESDVFDHFNNTRLRKSADLPPDGDTLMIFLSRYGDEVLGMTREENRRLFRFKSAEIEENIEVRRNIFNSYFPTVDKEEKEQVINNWSYRTIIPFISKYCPEHFKKQVHTGSMCQEFSGYLSASVGGPRFPDIYGARVTVEMVVPNDEVTVNEFGVSGEKEVLLTKLKLQNISRVFINDEQMRKEVLENPETQSGEFISRVYSQLSEDEQISEEPLSYWRWNEQTEDCLPVDLALDYQHKGKYLYAVKTS